MVEWHVTPDYIVANWTDELLDLMITKMVDRKEREREARGKPGKPDAIEVPAAVMFEDLGIKVKKG